MNEKKASNKTGNIGAILGIVGLLFSCVVLGLIPAIIGLIFSVKGLKKQEMKHGTSFIGLTTSLIAILISAIVIISYTMFFINPDFFREDVMDSEKIEQTESKASDTTAEFPDSEKLQTEKKEDSEEKADNYETNSTEIGWGAGNERENIGDTKINGGDVKDAATVYSLPYLKTYMEEHGIKYYGEKVYDEIEKWMMKNPDVKNIKIESGGAFKEDFYSLTNENTSYFYIGELKENKLNGFGILFEGVQAEIYERSGTTEQYLAIQNGWNSNVYHMLYAGNFKDGRYDGNGILFVPCLGEYEDYSLVFNDIVISDAMYDSCGQDLQTVVYSAAEAVKYCGAFKDGKYDGKGQKIMYTNSIIGGEELNEYLGRESADIFMVMTGEYKDGKMNGNIQEYLNGFLLYDGEIKNDMYDGKGTLYYNESDQVKYRGKFKDNLYDGKGTLYDESGEVIYNGKWKNGDYAN